jgi:flagellar biosynthesis/type III secretory pathway chaperone
MRCATIPVKPGRWPAIATGCAMLLAGCFFDQVQRSEESDIQRVEQKQAILQTEQERSARLGQQEERLAAEMSERQLSLNDLNARVQAINAENGRAFADNEVARTQYLDLLTQLHETNDELALALQDGSGSTAERRERIASLEARLKAQLDLLLR